MPKIHAVHQGEDGGCGATAIPNEHGEMGKMLLEAWE